MLLYNQTVYCILLFIFGLQIFLLMFITIGFELQPIYLVRFKAVANKDTMLRTHCCGHKCFPVCPSAQHLLRTQNLCPRHKNVSDFLQKHFLSATNVSRFAQHRNNHEQQCVRNIVSLFATTFNLKLANTETQVTFFVSFVLPIF